MHRAIRLNDKSAKSFAYLREWLPQGTSENINALSLRWRLKLFRLRIQLSNPFNDGSSADFCLVSVAGQSRLADGGWFQSL
jgi:hypothetical protein